MQDLNGLISDRLEQERKRNSHTQAQIAEIAGVSLSGYKNWKNGASIPSDALSRLAEVGYDVLYIVTGLAEPGESPWGSKPPRAAVLNRPGPDGFTLIPVFDVRVSAGGGALNHHAEVVKHLAFRSDWVADDLRRDAAQLVVVEVAGDSMSPTLNEADTLLVDRTEHQLADGIYVLDINDRLMVKRIQVLADGSVRLKSDNPAYSTEDIRDQELEHLVVVGRVVWVGRRV